MRILCTAFLILAAPLARAADAYFTNLANGPVLSSNALFAVSFGGTGSRHISYGQLSYELFSPTNLPAMGGVSSNSVSLISANEANLATNSLAAANSVLLAQKVTTNGPLYLLSTNNASGMTNLNGSSIASGTVADARVAATIARLTDATNAATTATNGLSTFFAQRVVTNNVLYRFATNNLSSGTNYSTTNLAGTILDGQIIDSITRDTEFTMPMGYPTGNLAVVAFGNNGSAVTNANPTNLFGAGTIPISKLARGTPTGTKFINDAGDLAVPAGGGGSSFPLTSTTILLTNFATGSERAITVVKDSDSTTNLALDFAFNSTHNTFYLNNQDGALHFTSHGATALVLDNMAGGGSVMVGALDSGELYPVGTAASFASRTANNDFSGSNYFASVTVDTNAVGTLLVTNRQASFDNLAPANPTAGNVVFWDGSHWVTNTLSSLTTGDVLGWNGSTWTNGPQSGNTTVTGATYANDSLTTVSNARDWTSVLTNAHTLTTSNTLSLNTRLTLAGTTNYLFSHRDDFFYGNVSMGSNTLALNRFGAWLDSRWVSNNLHAVLQITGLTNESAALKVQVLEQWVTNGVVSSGGGGGISYLVNQNFEGTGYDNSETWTESSPGPNPDYTTSPAPLHGSQSLRFFDTTHNVSTYTTFTANGDIYGHLMVRWTALPSSSIQFVRIGDGSGTQQGFLRISAAGGITVGNGSSEDGPTDAMSSGTTYHVWFRYNKGTGANGNAYVAFSTDATEPTSGTKYKSISNGTSTADAARLTLQHDADSTFDAVMDQVMVGTSDIGTPP